MPAPSKFLRKKFQIGRASRARPAPTPSPTTTYRRQLNRDHHRQNQPAADVSIRRTNPRTTGRGPPLQPYFPGLHAGRHGDRPHLSRPDGLRFRPPAGHLVGQLSHLSPADHSILRLIALFVIVMLLHILVSLPLSFYSHYVVEHQFGLSNQSFAPLAPQLLAEQRPHDRSSASRSTSACSGSSGTPATTGG